MASTNTRTKYVVLNAPSMPAKNVHRLCVSCQSHTRTGDVVTPGHSGYDKMFLYPLLKRHECPICLLAMRDPVQTECGHLFCRGCLEPVLSKDTPLCPLDNASLNKDDVSASLCLIEILASHVMNDWVHVPRGHRSFLTMLVGERSLLWR